MGKVMHDVIVVGAGPVGSYTAYLLVKKGLNVGIFERNPAIGKDVNCTGIVSAECFRKFDLPCEAILKPINSIKAFSPSGNYIRYQSVSPLAYVLSRGLFDQGINRMAVREGATTYLGTRVEKIKIEDSAFKVKVRINGKEREFISKIGIIATGFELNPLEGLTKKSKDFLYGVQTELKIKEVSDVEVYFGKEIAPGFFAWVVPTNGDSARIGLITKKTPLDYLRRFIQNPFITDRLNVFDNDNHIKCSPIPLGRTPKTYGERLIIVGEAAGQVKTTTGGGIYFGLLCSEIAVRTILKAFNKKDFSERTLKEYEIMWRNKLGPELKAGLLLRKIFSRLSDTQINLFIDLARNDGILSIIKENNFDWHRDLIISLLRNVFAKRIRVFPK